MSVHYFDLQELQKTSIFTNVSGDELENFIQYDNREGEIKNCYPFVPVQRSDTENGLQGKQHKIDVSVLITTVQQLSGKVAA